jgi:HK97 gp10 family phage protein
VSVRFKVEMEGKSQVLGALRALDFEGKKNVEEVVRLTARNVRRAAKAKAPVKSGRFRRSIGAKFSPDGLTAEVAAWRRGRQGPHPLSHIFEFGTAPHKIKPKNRKALAFHGGAQQGPGAEMGPEQATVRRSVQHPGTPATPFLFPAFEENRADYVRNLREAIGRAGREAAAKWRSHASRSQGRRDRASIRRAGL